LFLAYFFLGHTNYSSISKIAAAQRFDDLLAARATENADVGKMLAKTG